MGKNPDPTRVAKARKKTAKILDVYDKLLEGKECLTKLDIDQCCCWKTTGRPLEVKLIVSLELLLLRNLTGRPEIPTRSQN
ncbi:1044_t:CDS:2 [Scutellospora calospora]|uniref:1044_t:CDS:1 n=1 Tax=Scutellospora calospora TaxID=85575 RepID=A0ACA9KH96_9GLOM|nr:1044_t:CDS:2 [Scutellospora calospora]